MEIRLGQVFGESEGKGIQTHFADFLTENEFQAVESAVTVLQELHTIRYLRGFVKGNEEALLNYFQWQTDQWVEKIKSFIYMNFSEMDDCQLHANRYFLNYLSSMRTFIDHCETYLNRTFGGRHSEEFLEFKKMCSVLYDASFGYSFFWGLRNYAQHCGLPIGAIHFGYGVEDPKPGLNTANYEFLVVFKRDSLLGNYSEWKPVVKAALEAKPEEFDIVPLVLEVTSVINAMEDQLEVILQTRFFAAATLLNGYISKIKKDGGRVFIAYDIVTDDRNKIKNYASVDLMEVTVAEILIKAGE